MTRNQEEVIHQNLIDAKLYVETAQDNYDIAEYRLDYAKKLLKWAEIKVDELNEQKN
jgi:hypothetical protein